MLLSSFPLTLVVEADGTDSGAASTGKKFKSLFTMNTVQNIYKVTMQGDQGSRDGLVGKVLCIYIYTQVQGKGGERIPHALLFCHSRSHCSTIHTTPANKHSKWVQGQVQEIYTQRENRSKQTQIAQRSSHEKLRVTSFSSGWKTDQ